MEKIFDRVGYQNAVDAAAKEVLEKIMKKQKAKEKDRAAKEKWFEEID